MSLTDEDKRWINAQFERVEARFDRVEARFERVEARFERVEARIERVETSLLTEFHKWASPAEMRARTRAAVLRAMDAEVEWLGDRLKKLEGDRPV